MNNFEIYKILKEYNSYYPQLDPTKIKDEIKNKVEKQFDDYVPKIDTSKMPIKDLDFSTIDKYKWKENVLNSLGAKNTEDLSNKMVNSYVNNQSMNDLSNSTVSKAIQDPKQYYEKAKDLYNTHGISGVANAVKNAATQVYDNPIGRGALYGAGGAAAGLAGLYGLYKLKRWLFNDKEKENE